MTPFTNTLPFCPSRSVSLVVWHYGHTGSHFPSLSLPIFPYRVCRDIRVLLGRHDDPSRPPVDDSPQVPWDEPVTTLVGGPPYRRRPDRPRDPANTKDVEPRRYSRKDHWWCLSILYLFMSNYGWYKVSSRITPPYGESLIVLPLIVKGSWDRSGYYT